MLMHNNSLLLFDKWQGEVKIFVENKCCSSTTQSFLLVEAIYAATISCAKGFIITQ